VNFGIFHLPKFEKDLREDAGFLYMVQVGSQKYRWIISLIFSFTTLLIAKIG